MIKAMIVGQRDPPRRLAARGRMRAKHDDLVEALDGMFDDHHGELAGLLLVQIAFLNDRIAALGARAAELTAAIPAARGREPGRDHRPGLRREAHHHVRDVTFGEDSATSRTGSGPANLATIRAAIIAAIKDAGYLHVPEVRRDHTTPAETLRLHGLG